MDTLAVYDSDSGSETTSCSQSTGNSSEGGKECSTDVNLERKRSVDELEEGNERETKRRRLAVGDESVDGIKKEIPKIALPSPSELLDGTQDLDALNVDVSLLPQKDDPLQHGGRLRNFPHTVGDYATSVYIPVVIPQEMSSNLQTIIEKLQVSCPDLVPIVDKLVDGEKLNGSCSATTLHISLSRVVPIRYPQIEPLIDTLQRFLKKTKKFDVTLGVLKSFVNDNGTRSFASLMVDGGKQEVCNLVRKVDKAFMGHGLQQFYEDPRPHISIAWVLGNKDDSLQPILDKMNQAQEMHKINKWKFEVSSIECRIGQRVYQIWRC